MGESFSLHGKRMRVVTTAPGGVVNSETLFAFTQEGEVVSARYAGGQVRLGFLVGIISAATLRFRYTQLDDAGRLDGGASECELSKTPGGRVRMLEHFQWASREGSGTNVFEEVPEDA